MVDMGSFNQGFTRYTAVVQTVSTEQFLPLDQQCPGSQLGRPGGDRQPCGTAADHPDIEDFINWKVLEEQKVASIVAGSKMHEERLNEIFAAIGTNVTGKVVSITDYGCFVELQKGIEGLVQNYADGRSCQFAVESALGSPLTELEAQWRQDILGESPPGTPLENLLPWIVLVTAILLIPLAITIGKLRKNRK